jgi:hypothetical protein
MAIKADAGFGGSKSKVPSYNPRPVTAPAKPPSSFAGGKPPTPRGPVEQRGLAPPTT